MKIQGKKPINDFNWPLAGFTVAFAVAWFVVYVVYEVPVF